jgi:hypothetical protein
MNYIVRFKLSVINPFDGLFFSEIECYDYKINGNLVSLFNEEEQDIMVIHSDNVKGMLNKEIFKSMTQALKQENTN